MKRFAIKLSFVGEIVVGAWQFDRAQSNLADFRIIEGPWTWF
jgi:hypothetical protein